MSLTALQRSILYTVAYSQQFDYPLLLEEIWLRLIGRLDKSVSLLTPAQVRSLKSSQDLLVAVSDLQTKGLLQTTSGYFFLSGQGRSLKLRQLRRQVVAKKQAEVRAFMSWAERCPWIQAVFVTGSVAVENAAEDDDIDFMLVTDPRRLWLTRVLVSLYATSRGRRRSWQGEEQRSWCFNLWLTTDQLGVFAQTPTLYTAYELLQARCVYDHGGVANKLLEANAWVTQFLPQFPLAERKPPIKTSKVSKVPKSFFKRVCSAALDLAEKLAFQVQLQYMKPHMTRERVGSDQAFFHPRDTQAMIAFGWSNSLKKLEQTLDQ